MPVRHLPLALALLLASCGGDVASMRPTPAQEFVIEAEGDRFRRRILRGDGGFNAPWSWHLGPLSIEVPQVSIELCDGRPSMVQADLDYWVDTVGMYCPWAARVRCAVTEGSGARSQGVSG